MKAAALLCLAVPLFAGTYKAQIGPYDAATISAEASGRIVKLDLRDEMRTVNDKVVIEIDHALDDIRLKNLKSKLRLLREQIDLKKAQYDSIKDLKSQNRFTKDQYRTQLLTLKMQADDLRSAIAQLEDTIAKKRFRVRGKYIKRFYVRKGEYVAPGVKLMRLEDHSGGRIVLYVDAADRAVLDRATITVQGEKGWRVEKASTTTDETYLSYYRVELVKKGEVPYGRVVTVTIEPAHSPAP
jgi:multidrug resistance efflux pump